KTISATKASAVISMIHFVFSRICRMTIDCSSGVVERLEFREERKLRKVQAHARAFNPCLSRFVDTLARPGLSWYTHPFCRIVSPGACSQDGRVTSRRD